MTENTTPNMNETEIKVKTLINKIRPYLQRDGGDVEYVRMDEGIVYVRLHGACVGCTSADLTLKDGIEAILLEEVPGVIGVEKVD
jgi:Fe-S cluster biogenesis protein NfuA